MCAVEQDIDLVYFPDQGCQNQDIGKPTVYTYMQCQANPKPKIYKTSPAKLARFIDPIPQNPQLPNFSVSSLFRLEAAHVDNIM